VTLDPSDPIAGPLGGFSSGIRAFVDATEEKRAQAILEDSNLSDSELAYLATGQLPGESAE
jgi:predicted neutral ceramidase superfamily lipid hydrolase